MGKQKLFSVSIHDCRVEAIASTGGAGGQNKNRRHTAIRITHTPSNAVGFSADEREQLQNKRLAFRRMAQSKEFQLWTRTQAAKLSGEPSVEEVVEDMMRPENLKVEVRTESGWTKESNSESGNNGPSA